jgi:4-amino-4-deoxychorismate lyase
MYGDGLFETIAVVSGGPCLWDAHMERLRKGAHRLSIPCPPQSLLRDECLSVVGDHPRCVVKLVLTRGIGGRGYGPPERPRPTRILSRFPWPEYPQDRALRGVSVHICRTRLAEQPALAGLKHLNRLEQVIARSEWADPERAEGLMCDGRGRVIGGTMSNLFVFRNGGLETPRLDSCGIAGTVRGLVMGTSRQLGISAVERDMYASDLLSAEGLFLTNALIGVWPVRQLGERSYDVGLLPPALLDRVRASVHQADAESRDSCAPC